MRRKAAVRVTVILVLLTFGFLEFFGIIWHNELFASSYEVKGLRTFSHHRGKMDWDRVGAQDNGIGSCL